MLRLLSSVRGAVSRQIPRGPTTGVRPLSFVVDRKYAREPSQAYKPGGFHPINVGEVYNERYEVVRQLGWGVYSTVWLVQDVKDKHLAAMKVLVGSLTNDKSGWDEPGIMRDLHAKNPESPGYRHIVQLLDEFVIEGPNGKHITLVVEAMDVSVFDVYRRMRDPMPLPLVKRVAKHTLLALQYMHECNLIHTDIKGENILMTGQPLPTVPDTFELSLDDLLSQTFKLADFGSANRADKHFTSLIQPVALRSPEVILSAEWDTKTDIWNFGCLMYEFARGAKLFDPFWRNEESGLNPSETHLAQMTGLLGQFSSRLLAQGKQSDLYFDQNGRLRKGEGQYDIRLVDLLSRTSLPLEDVQLTADFLALTLAVDPEERSTAAQLLKHPWLDGID